MSLKKILSAAAFTLAGLAGNASAQDDCDPRSDNLTATYVATLTGAIGENAKKHLLELAAEGFRQEPWESRMRAFEKHFGSAQKPVDKDNSFRPAFGYVTHVSEPDKKKCVVYLYHDTNKNGIQDIGGDVQPELQERELLCIPRNTLMGDERNAPYVAACDEHVGAFEKIFTYQLFVPPEKDISTKYRFANTHGKKQKQEMKQCLLATARDGIQRHKEQFVLSSEGAAVMSSIDNLFENPATIAENGYGVAVFTFGKQHYSFLFRDENTNGEHDKGEPLLSIIQKNDTITPYTAECAIPPENGEMTLDEKIERLEKEKDYAAIAELLVQNGRKNDAIRYYYQGGYLSRAAALAREVGNLPLAIRMYQAAKKPEQAAETLEQLAETYRSGGEEKEARDAYVQAALEYEKADKSQRAGFAAEKAGDLTRALANFSKAEDNLNVGRILEQTGEIDKAIDAYQKAEEFNKAASLAEKTGAYPRALELYQKGNDAQGIKRMQEIIQQQKKPAEKKGGVTYLFAAGGHGGAPSGEITGEFSLDGRVRLLFGHDKFPLALVLGGERLHVSEQGNAAPTRFGFDGSPQTLFTGTQEKVEWWQQSGSAGITVIDHKSRLIPYIGVQVQRQQLSIRDSTAKLVARYSSVLFPQGGLLFLSYPFAASVLYAFEHESSGRTQWVETDTRSGFFLPFEEHKTHNLRLNAYVSLNERFLMRLSAQSEGARVGLCNILPCSGDRGRMQIGGGILFHPLMDVGNRLSVGLGIGWSYQLRGLNPYYQNEEFNGGIYLTIGIRRPDTKAATVPLILNW